MCVLWFITNLLVTSKYLLVSGASSTSLHQVSVKEGNSIYYLNLWVHKTTVVHLHIDIKTNNLHKLISIPVWWWMVLGSEVLTWWCWRVPVSGPHRQSCCCHLYWTTSTLAAPVLPGGWQTRRKRNKTVPVHIICLCAVSFCTIKRAHWHRYGCVPVGFVFLYLHKASIKFVSSQHGFRWLLVGDHSFLFLLHQLLHLHTILEEKGRDVA